MQEIKEVQAYNRKEFAMLAVANFKHMLFRYRILSKMERMKQVERGKVDHSKVKTEIMDMLLST